MKINKHTFIKWKYIITCVFCISLFSIQAQDLNYIPETTTITGNEGNTNPTEYDGTGSFSAGSAITTGDNNLFLGYGTGATLNQGSLNVIIGNLAGSSLNSSTDSDNIIIGQYAADLSTSSVDNVLIGKYVARAIDGGDNVVIGTEAGMAMTTANDNIIIGEEAGESLTEGDRNVIIGENAGFRLTTGSDNIFIGRNTGGYVTTADGNTVIGGSSSNGVPTSLPAAYDFDQDAESSGNDLSTGVGNVFVGGGSGQDNSDGFANTYLGYGAGANSSHADGNTFVGYAAGWDNNRTNAVNNANRNTYFGAMAGGTNRIGSDNVGMGWTADFDDTSVKNERNVFIGNNTIVSGNNTVVIGHNAQSTNDNIGNIVLGSESSVNKNYAVAIGYDVDVTQAKTMALGGDTTTNRLSVGIGTVTANKNASLELADTDKGLLLNRVTTAERITMITAPASGVALTTTEAGLIVYDTNENALYNWDGVQWVAVLADNLGNHIAATNLQTNTNWISNDGDDEGIYVDVDGKVGVGISTLIANFVVHGTTTLNEGTVLINDYELKFLNKGQAHWSFFNEETTGKFQLAKTSLSATPGVSSVVEYAITVDNTNGSYVGIGTTSPSHKLDVAGTGRFTDALTIGSYTLPVTDGSVNQVLSTDGSGMVTWTDATANTDAQDLALTGTVLSLTNDASTVDLSPLTADLETRVTALENALQASGSDMTPQQFNYQAVVRDINDDVLVNTLVNFRISILKGSNTGIASYTETHTVTTTTKGLTNLSIGNGTLLSGDFTTIDWGTDIYFLKIEADITGGTSYLELGTSQLVSVPYALHANSADSIAGYDTAKLSKELKLKDSKIENLEKEVNALKKTVQQLIDKMSKSSK